MTAIHYPVLFRIKPKISRSFRKEFYVLIITLSIKKTGDCGIFPVRAGCGFTDGVSEKFFPDGGIYRAVYWGCKSRVSS